MPHHLDTLFLRQNDVYYLCCLCGAVAANDLPAFRCQLTGAIQLNAGRLGDRREHAYGHVETAM
jgi:hypothetical protein